LAVFALFAFNLIADGLHASILTYDQAFDLDRAKKTQILHHEKMGDLLFSKFFVLRSVVFQPVQNFGLWGLKGLHQRALI
jgi:hypothetical protein